MFFHMNAQYHGVAMAAIPQKGHLEPLRMAFILYRWLGAAVELTRPIRAIEASRPLLMPS